MMQVKLALSQDIVLTTISPQRSVMATAVHNLQEVKKCLSYITVSILRLNGVAVNLKGPGHGSSLYERFSETFDDGL